MRRKGRRRRRVRTVLSRTRCSRKASVVSWWRRRVRDFCDSSSLLIEERILLVTCVSSKERRVLLRQSLCSHLLNSSLISLRYCINQLGCHYVKAAWLSIDRFKGILIISVFLLLPLDLMCVSHSRVRCLSCLSIFPLNSYPQLSFQRTFSWHQKMFN